MAWAPLKEDILVSVLPYTQHSRPAETRPREGRVQEFKADWRRISGKKQISNKLTLELSQDSNI